MLSHSIRIMLILLISFLVDGCGTATNPIPTQAIPNGHTSLPYAISTSRAQIYITYLHKAFCFIDCPGGAPPSLILRNQTGAVFSIPRPLANNDYSCVEVRPGRYTLFNRGGNASLSINLQAGKVYYIGAKTTIDTLTGAPRYTLSQLSAKEGSYYVHQTVARSKQVVQAHISWTNEVVNLPAMEIPQACNVIN